MQREPSSEMYFHETHEVKQAISVSDEAFLVTTYFSPVDGCHFV
jgi:hypothetical protein